MKRIILAVACLFVVGCVDNVDTRESAQTALLREEAERQVGLPNIVNFQERKLAKLIFELRDSEKLVCFAYTEDMAGKLHFRFKCLGYGLPYSTQITNPMKLASSQNRESTAVPQPEPNGLFMPDSAEATWLFALDKDGRPHPVYVESRVIVSPFALHDE